MPERIDFWGIPDGWVSPAVVVYAVMGIASLVLLVRLYRRASVWWRVGRREPRWDHPVHRIGRVIQYAVVQTRLLKQRFPGLMHVGLAWGFFVFFLGTALATIDSHVVKILVGSPYLWYKLILDTFTFLFLVGALMAGYRRCVKKPSRLTLHRRFQWALALIVAIVVGGLVVESLRLAVEQPSWAIWSPFGWLVAQVWLATGASESTLLALHTWMWGIHLATVAAFFVVLPSGSLLHIVSGPLNVFFSRLDRPLGRLAPVASGPSGDPVYASELRHLTWKQLLEGDACTECGRCQDACPAHAAGTPLSPKQLIVSVRDALSADHSAATASAAARGEDNGRPAALVGERITDETLWSCTSCAACVGECPVLIDHVDTIVDMRRYLVMEGRMDGELQDALANLGRYGNSFGQSERARGKWTQGLAVPVRDVRKEPAQYLWFVGDYASYSATMADVTRKTAEVFQHAGLDFGILYDGERNSGNDVRRIGEEGLFELLAEKNAAALARSEYETIVTTDPHSLNALKNEYALDGIRARPVLHYSELLAQLIARGDLRLTNPLMRRVTYHDPCYLARYNGVTDAPRRVIAAAGCELVEMPRHGTGTFCCGAGGGRIWMGEESVTDRPSEIRIREAAGLEGVGTFVVACPKDVTMFRDAVKTLGLDDKLVVTDLAELVHEAM